MDKEDMRADGKIFLVSGGTSGVGRSVALGIARQGGKVVVVSRSHAGGEAAVRYIAEHSGNDGAEYLVGDLADMASLARLADDFKRRFDRLDVLANIAGAMIFEKATTAEGFDRSFAVNYLGHFALTHHLLDLLKADAPARVVTMTGNPRFLGKPLLDLDVLQGRGPYKVMAAVTQAMFARTYFAFALARRLQGTGVASIAFHPGLVKSNLLGGAPLFLRAFGFVSNLFAAEGSDSGVYVACSPDVEAANGAFIDDKRVRLSLPEIFDPAVGEALWVLSEDLLRQAAPAAGSL